MHRDPSVVGRYFSVCKIISRKPTLCLDSSLKRHTHNTADFSAKVSAETFAEIINSFIEPISYKTMVSSHFCICLISATGRYEPHLKFMVLSFASKRQIHNTECHPWHRIRIGARLQSRFLLSSLAISTPTERRLPPRHPRRDAWVWRAVAECPGDSNGPWCRVAYAGDTDGNTDGDANGSAAGDAHVNAVDSNGATENANEVADERLWGWDAGDPKVAKE